MFVEVAERIVHCIDSREREIGRGAKSMDELVNSLGVMVPYMEPFYF